MSRASMATRRPADGRPGHPDAGRLAGLLVLAWSEVLDGRRSFTQLAPLLSPAISRRLAAELATQRGRPAREVRLRRVMTSFGAPGTCEASVIVEREGRVTAVAVRLERHRGAWRIVEFTAPEAGLSPLITASRPEGGRDAFDEVLAEAAGETSFTPRGTA